MPLELKFCLVYTLVSLAHPTLDFAFSSPYFTHVAKAFLTICT